MKKFVCAMFSIIFMLLFCGCDSRNTVSSEFGQEVTIAKLPSPPKCKTTDSVSVANEIIDVLAQIEKKPLDSEKINGGWQFMIKLKIDGQSFNYTIGNIFTDSDKKQYIVENCNEITEKITKIYDKIDAPEVDYP